MEPGGGSSGKGEEDKDSREGWSRRRMMKRDAAVTVERRKGWKSRRGTKGG